MAEQTPLAAAARAQARRLPSGPGAPETRRWELDALRGLMLVLMTSTHLPTWFAYSASQPFGFVSAAEGFVFLSAYMAGLVYTQRATREGIPAMRRAFLHRATILYLCQAASLLFLFTIIAGLGIQLLHQPAAQRLVWFYLEQPFTALWASLMLIYNPPLLDILPVYIFYMLASPWVLAYGLQHGWKLPIAASIGLWLAAQFKLSQILYGSLVNATGLQVPFSETGAFETFAWQILWVAGLALGALHARTPADQRRPLPRWLCVSALGIVACFFAWRHLSWMPLFTLNDTLMRLSDKWYLGPMRLLNFFALVVVLLGFGSWLRARAPRVRWLETLGAASLPVFCAHLVLVLFALAVLGDSSPARPPWLDPLLYITCIVLMHEVAMFVVNGRSGPGGGKRALARAAQYLRGLGSGGRSVGRGNEMKSFPL